MDTWEYFTTFIEANMGKEDVIASDEMPPGNHPQYSPFALIPELNKLGTKGWELIHMEPVVPGKNHDVVTPDAGAMRWGRHYFCVFKRRTTVS
ncbi:MAG: hypothetical protein R3C62_02580 [Chloroflexota bacterium]